MRDTYHRLYVHAVWETWDRQALITPQIEAAVYADVRVECEKVKAELLEIGGVADHVHIVARIPPTLCVADLLKQVKGGSSHMTTHRLPAGEQFRWQGAYAAFTVSEGDLPRVRAYVKNQKAHHGGDSLLEGYEIDAVEHN